MSTADWVCWSIIGFGLVVVAPAATVLVWRDGRRSKARLDRQLDWVARRHERLRGLGQAAYRLDAAAATELLVVWPQERRLLDNMPRLRAACLQACLEAGVDVGMVPLVQERDWSVKAKTLAVLAGLSEQEFPGVGDRVPLREWEFLAGLRGFARWGSQGERGAGKKVPPTA